MPVWESPSRSCNKLLFFGPIVSKHISRNYSAIPGIEESPTRTSPESGLSKLSTIDLEFRRTTNSVGAFLTAAASGPVTILQLRWVRATILLRANGALVGLAEN
jgi:hypothetical protein